MAQPPGLEDAPPVAISVTEGPKSPAELENLIAKATAKYAVKDYSGAAEEYSRATELQAELNGEMSPQNADLLYLYGRCLYHVAVENSDVLGAKVAKEEKQKKKAAASSGKVKPKKEALDAIAEDGGEVLSGGSARGPNREHVIAVKQAPDSKPAEQSGSEIPEELKTGDEAKTDGEKAEGASSKPYFNITGDENWDDSDEEDAADAEEEEDAEDDFSNAFEVLDIARVLLEKRIAEFEKNESRQEAEGRAEALGKTVIDLKKLRERLADTRDLQAEISLEAERFSDAATDLRAALEMKQELFPEESSLIAEGHYKLSLALEFSAITPATDVQGNVQPGTVGEVDQKLRDEAAVHMEKAIASCQKRVALEEKALAGKESYEVIEGEKKVKITQKSIDEVKEMVGDMEQRLEELKKPPVNVNAAASQPDPSELSGILGSLIGESAESQKAKIEALASNANDLSGLVKKKKPAAGEKRKADDADAQGQTAGKKPKQEE